MIEFSPLSAASLLQVRDKDTALPHRLGLRGCCFYYRVGKKVRIPLSSSAKEGYQFLQGRNGRKLGFHSQVCSRVHHCYCKTVVEN